jgi:hypothetical protein
MVYSGDWGKLIHGKNQKSKISWHCPFKGAQVWDFDLLDSNDFNSMKSLQVGHLRADIKIIHF